MLLSTTECRCCVMNELDGLLLQQQIYCLIVLIFLTDDKACCTLHTGVMLMPNCCDMFCPFDFCHCCCLCAIWATVHWHFTHKSAELCPYFFFLPYLLTVGNLHMMVSVHVLCLCCSLMSSQIMFLSLNLHFTITELAASYISITVVPVSYTVFLLLYHELKCTNTIGQNFMWHVAKK